MGRFREVPGHPFEGGFSLSLVPEKLEEPLRWSKPRKIFTCSMSDLFHEEVPRGYIRQIFDVMEKADWHIFQVLTKRSKRLLDLSPKLPWPDNIWMGVSVENSETVYRTIDLASTQASMKFMSVEPLLGPIDHIPLEDIDWVIVGGESGPSARPMDPAWARGIRDQCQDQGVAFFLKQLGGRHGKRGGSDALLDGKLWHQLPDAMKRFAA